MDNEYIEKNILVIGNGFDLYHLLPTRYTDFLFFVNHFSDFINEYKTNMGEYSEERNKELFKISLDNSGKLIQESIQDYLKYNTYYNPNSINYLDNNLCENAWVKYFIQTGYEKEGWIDFENEIEKVLKSVEEYYNKILPGCVDKVPNTVIERSISLIIDIFGKNAKDPFKNRNTSLLRKNDVFLNKLQKEKNALILSMKNELDVLNKCLYIYLNEFVINIDCKVYSSQIKNLRDVYLLNFNYTYSYSNIYGKNSLVLHHPVHGSLSSDNLVLGICDDTFDNLDYIYFQKYFQRIQKRTGVFYKKWLDDNFDTQGNIPIKVYIMGHSLSKTDKGIFRDIFENETVEKIIIYYHSQNAYEEQIINLIDMFGKNFVIEQVAIERIEFTKLMPPEKKSNF